ncbi:MAG: hypothetical protein IKU25_05220 [Clostridia bacterium]|nr:hypothetical protein [Clostridia bacterium]
MKKAILSVLSRGYCTTKKYNADDFQKYLYFLKYIMQNAECYEGVNIKSNEFWSYENNKNRFDLIDDVKKTDFRRFPFSICNRFENGDGYGIKKQ